MEQVAWNIKNVLFKSKKRFLELFYDWNECIAMQCSLTCYKKNRDN